MTPVLSSIQTWGKRHKLMKVVKRQVRKVEKKTTSQKCQNVESDEISVHEESSSRITNGNLPGVNS